MLFPKMRIFYAIRKKTMEFSIVKAWPNDLDKFLMVPNFAR